MKQKLNNVIEKNGKLFTEGASAFSGRAVRFGDKSYAEWEAGRSKLAAAIAKGMKVEINPGSRILYLGAAHGYTISFLSRVCNSGKIFAVEFAPRVAREMVLRAEQMDNVLPIVADANQPGLYYHLMQSVDVVFQDIAQRNQVEILVKNCNLFLERNGIAMIAVKARSIDSTRKPQNIFAEVKKELESHFRIEGYCNLAPMQKDHAFFICRKR